ncbi:MAG: GntR family transcriptional regulator [Casimicrobium sp.]
MPAAHTDRRATLKKELIALIRRNVDGGRLPAERQLAERFGVARETLRKALQELADEGALSRKQGSGTYVADAPWVKPLQLHSFSEDMRSRGLKPSSTLLSATKVRASAKVAQKLKIIPGADVYEVRRLRLADDEPMALEVVYLSCDHFPKFDVKRLARESLYDVLEREYDSVPRAAVQQIQATVVTEDEAAQLNVAPFSPALLVERQVQTASGETIEYGKSLYRADRYNFEMNVSRGNGGDR